MVSVRAATEVAYEFATSFAPLPKALKTKAIVVKAKIQSYLAVMGGAMTADCAKIWWKRMQSENHEGTASVGTAVFIDVTYANAKD
jgi:hypothetical protein